MAAFFFRGKVSVLYHNLTSIKLVKAYSVPSAGKHLPVLNVRRFSEGINNLLNNFLDLNYFKKK